MALSVVTRPLPRRVLLAGALPFCLSTAALSAEPACPDPVRPEPRDYPDEALAALRVTDGRTNLLAGDSIAAWWPPASIEHWMGGPVENLGFPGDTPRNVLWRLGRVPVGRPWRRIVLIAGVNAAWNDPTCHDVAAGVEADVLALRHLAPAARIVVVAVMPHQPGLTASLPAIAPINARLAGDADRLGFRFVDPGPDLRAACEGRSACPLLRDWLHPTDAGYAVIGARIAAAFAAPWPQH